MNNLPDFENKKTILVAPLNWGLGHATRLIPIIKHYNETHRIILAGNNPSLKILTASFPQLKAIELPEQTFNFDTNFFSIKNIFSFSHQLNRSIRNDYNEVKNIVSRYKIDIIISDNRYGLWHPNTYNILITHQLAIKLPSPWTLLEKTIHQKVLRKIKKFDECWIPDFSGKENLSGDLSHKYSLPANAKFIGPLSRFQVNLIPAGTTGKKVLIILSGPEPQRTIFEKRLEKFFSSKKASVTILQGKPDSGKSTDNNFVTKIPHTNDVKFLNLVKSHSIIIGRAGYSTIMDFYFLRKSIILIPTPKQTEQIYLANHLKNHPLFSFVEEKNIEKYLTNIIHSSF